MAGGNIFGRAMSYVLNELVVDKLANRYIFVSFIELVVYYIYIYIYVCVCVCVCVCVNLSFFHWPPGVNCYRLACSLEAKEIQSM